MGVTRNHCLSTKRAIGTTQALLPPFDTEDNLVSSSSHQKPCQALTQTQAFFPKYLPWETLATVPQLRCLTVQHVLYLSIRFIGFFSPSKTFLLFVKFCFFYEVE